MIAQTTLYKLSMWFVWCETMTSLQVMMVVNVLDGEVTIPTVSHFSVSSSYRETGWFRFKQFKQFKLKLSRCKGLFANLGFFNEELFKNLLRMFAFPATYQVTYSWMLKLDSENFHRLVLNNLSVRGSHLEPQVLACFRRLAGGHNTKRFYLKSLTLKFYLEPLT